MTVQEAITKYKTRTLFSKKDEAEAQSKIKPDEEVLWAGDFNVYSSGSTKPGTVVLTDQRIFFCHRSSTISLNKEFYLPIEDIIQVQWLLEKGMGFLVIWSARDVMRICCRDTIAKPCMDLLEQLRKAKGSQKNVGPAEGVTAADELVRWKQLLDTGVITQTEFEAKKKQLLGL